MSLQKFPLILSTLFLFISLSTAKFKDTYRGIATDGVQACLTNSPFTVANVSAKENCREAFHCVMDNIPNYGQAILSSGAAVFGFIPTVHLILGPSNSEIMRIHARYPILAFCLSITNINKRPDKSLHHHPESTKPNTVALGSYGYATLNTKATSRAKLISVSVAHVLAGIGAAIVIWQTEEIGRNAVVSWACWTDFYPLLWVVTGVLHHLLSILCLRLNLRKANGRSVLWVWDLTEGHLGIRVLNHKWARWSKAGTDLLNNANYLYGTAVFSSLTLVTGMVAMEKLAALGVIAVLTKGAAVWILEDMDEQS